MKLKKIKINGIRGFQYLDKPHIIDLDLKHSFLYGENGSGKSSFFDALEWALIGYTEEAKKRRIDSKDIIFNKFIKGNDDPFIEINYKEGGNEKIFSRSKTKSNTIFEYEKEALNCFIECYRIEEFVINTKQSLWNSFADLLGFNDLITFKKQLTRLQNLADQELNNILVKARDNEQIFLKLKNEINQSKSKFKNELGDNWEEKLKSVLDKGASKILIGVKKLLDISNNYQKTFKIIKLNSEELENKRKQYNEEKSKTTAEKIAKIIDETYKYFKDIENLEKCPVCDQIINFKEVSERISNLRETFSLLLRLDKEINDLEITIEKSKSDLKNIINELKQEKDIIQQLNFGSLLIEIDKFGQAYDTINNIISNYYETIKNKESDLEKVVDNQGVFTIYNEKIKELEKIKIDELKQELKIKNDLYNDVKSFFDNYNRLYSEKIKSELDEISKNEVTKIYNAINQSSDEMVERIIIEPNIENQEIEFKVKLKNCDVIYNPLDILSTGHLRCLGFALLIARIKIKRKNLDFIVIDDPIYSIDHDHRYYLINYLRELGRDFQLIITTSDRLFYDIIRHVFNRQNYIAYKVNFKCDEGTILGINIDKQPATFIAYAKNCLNNDDFRAAALYARLALETKLFLLAAEKKLRLEIPFDRIKKLGIKELWDAGLKNKLICKFQNKEIEINKAFETLTNHNYFRKLIGGFPLDEEIHHPYEHRILYTKPEIENVICSLTTFFDTIDNIVN